MDLYEELLKQARPVGIVESETSYFSNPSERLDPMLFRETRLIPAVRDGILATLYGHLNKYYTSPESWTTVWLAGSGVSYQWIAHRDPGDLDCLVGVDFVSFRSSNRQFAGLTNKEIASMLNEGFRNELQPETSNYLNSYELTFYVNVATDIRRIKPYAAYSLTSDDWTVFPSAGRESFPEDWFTKADKDTRMAQDIIDRYQSALNDITVARNEVAMVNAKTTLLLAAKQGSALFEDIHQGRRSAFSEAGLGYTDYANFRWQRGKATGAVQALKQLKEIEAEAQKAFQLSIYGEELPDASTLIRRAAAKYRS